MAVYRRRDQDDEARQGLADTTSYESAPLVGQGSSDASARSAPKDYTRSNFVSGKALVDKNRNQGTPNISGSLSTRIDNKVGEYRRGGDEYAGKVGGLTNSYSYDDNTINSGLTGPTNGENWQRLSKVLGGATEGDVMKVGEYEPRFGLGIKDFNAMNTAAGSQGLFRDEMNRRGYQSGYTGGMASLDSTLFGQSEAGRQQRLDTLGQRGAASDVYGQEQDEATSALDAALGEIKNRGTLLREDLTDRRTGLTRSAEEKATTLRNQQQSESGRVAAAGNFTDEAKTIADSVRFGIEGENPEFATFWDKKLAESGLLSDPKALSEYVRMGEVGGPQYSSDEAQRYNRILDLFGENAGGFVSAGKGPTANALDKEGFVKTLSGLEEAARGDWQRVLEEREKAKIAEGLKSGQDSAHHDAEDQLNGGEAAKVSGAVAGAANRGGVTAGPIRKKPPKKKQTFWDKVNPF